MTDAFITAAGAFLPGPPIGSDAMEDVIGAIAGRPSALGRRALKWNGVETRHYALNPDGTPEHDNADMAARAVAAALEDGGRRARDLDFLATGTTQGDLIVPGHASAVHAALAAGWGVKPLELASFQSVCASGLMALKSAMLHVRAGEAKCAGVVGSEFSSRWFRPGFFEDTALLDDKNRAPLEAEFLRWTLSDGAGAVLVEPRPRGRFAPNAMRSDARTPPLSLAALDSSPGHRARERAPGQPKNAGREAAGGGGATAAPRFPPPLAGEAPRIKSGGSESRRGGVSAGLSLRIDWIDLVSYADRFGPCMWAGATKEGRFDLKQSWSFKGPRAAWGQGAIALQQDFDLLKPIIRAWVARYLELVEAGRIDPRGVDHVLCHYSAESLRVEIVELLKAAGGMIAEERWFSNLRTKGNTGAASIFVMLEELRRVRSISPGERLLLVVPESGRAMVGFAMLTAVEGEGG